MKKYALAALLALPLLGFLTETASAQSDCCGGYRPWSPVERKYYVTKTATVYDRKDRDYITYANLKAGNYVFAKCYRSGWCQIEPRLYENTYVLKDCLEAAEERAEYRPRPRSQYDEDPGAREELLDGGGRFMRPRNSSSSSSYYRPY